MIDLHAKEEKRLIEATKGFVDVLDELKPENKEKTYNFWKSLRKANIDFSKTQIGDFDEFMLETYGIKLYRVNDQTNISGYAAEFDVADDHKYLMFKLKYA